QAGQIMLFSGQTTLNDIQEKAGRPSFEMPEADEPFIVTGNTIQFLNGLLAQDEAGEVTGQVGNSAKPLQGGGGNGNPQNQNSPQEGHGQEQVDAQKPQAGGDNEGQAASPVIDDKAKLAELATFGRFVRRSNKNGKYSKFEFDTIDDRSAEVLNDKAYFLVKGAATMPPNMTEWALETIAVSGEILKGPSTLESVS
ncbi:MAG: hypothetical protein WCD70_04485, partial [Alphaproteobacteria bacterium]